uniref:ATP synthase subunit a n=1 Tax=Trigonopterus sp. 7 AH-2016 TaxID=1903841 RepID=A0A343C428_9CUCU|nr:ATP synthase F0 subunit 6 [Trigonopterus sp. 7 AH-2016]
MMTSLFSSFDPSSMYLLSLNWSSTLIFILIFPSLYWISPSRFLSMWMILMFMLHKELKTLMKTKKYLSSTLIFSSLLIFILMNNFMGLFPYIFTSTSHLNFTLYLSLPLWISFMIYGWLNNTVYMLAHLTPQGAPKPLLPFLVIIETISNMIRPGTLAVRLTANMIAGHLLITILSSSGPSLNFVILNLLILAQIMLLTLELAVSLIQSYVFSILVTLYATETN